jgi:hypothetical protein
MEWVGDLGEVLDEAAVEVGKPDESSDVTERLGDRPVADSFNLGGVHADLSLMDNQAQVLDLGLLELAFLGSEVEIVLLQVGKDLVDDGAVLFQGRCEDEDFV